MKLTHLATALSAFALAAPALAQEAPYTPPEDELVEARAIMNAMFPPETREESMLEIMESMGRQVADGMMQGPVFQEPGIKAIMDEFIAELPVVMRPMVAEYLPEMIDSTAIAYTREFTLEELQDISAFAATPSGKRYFELSPAITGSKRFAEANQRYLDESVALLGPARSDLMERIDAYMAEQEASKGPADT